MLLLPGSEVPLSRPTRLFPSENSGASIRAQSAMVGTRSWRYTGCSQTLPASTPGPTISSGTRVECSYRFCFPINPWLPTANPWSEVKTTIVVSSRPVFCNASMILPTWASIWLIIA